MPLTHILKANTAVVMLNGGESLENPCRGSITKSKRYQVFYLAQTTNPIEIRPEKSFSRVIIRSYNLIFLYISRNTILTGGAICDILFTLC